LKSNAVCPAKRPQTRARRTQGFSEFFSGYKTLAPDTVYVHENSTFPCKQILKRRGWWYRS